MAVLVEQESDKAARILAVSRELVLRRGVRGVTMAEIAEKAHVAKGTVYLYWSTKEDLVLGMVARDFLAVVDDYLHELTEDPDLARPSRLCPHLLGTALHRPFVRAMQTGDVELLGAFARDPRSRRLLDRLGPAALMYMALPVWREHGLARTDWALDDQAYALRALLAGFLETAVRTPTCPDIPVDSPGEVLAGAVTALLGPEQAEPDEVRTVAEEGVRLLRESRKFVLASLAG